MPAVYSYRSPPQDGSTLAKHLPANYRQMIANDFKTWPDYQGMIIREAKISNGKTQFGDIMRGGTTATVCVNYKTRNILGQEGYFTEAFFFTNGELAHGGLKPRRSAAVLACSSDRIFSPFPEANTA